MVITDKQDGDTYILVGKTELKRNAKPLRDNLRVLHLSTFRILLSRLLSSVLGLHLGLCRQSVTMVGESGRIIVLVIPIALFAAPLAHEHIAD